MEALLAITSVITIGCIYVIYNLLKKVEKYEDTVEDYNDLLLRLSNVITESEKHLDKLDSEGMYRADDEVGEFFENMRTVQESISRFKV